MVREGTPYILNTKFLRTTPHGFNSILSLEAFIFKKVIILSESLREKLSLRKKKTYIITLGSEPASYPMKTFNEINLLYVGTLSSRNIHQTIEGISLFVKTRTQNITIRYYIVGGGKTDEVEKLKEAQKYKAKYRKLIGDLKRQIVFIERALHERKRRRAH
jgi:hypothetical protein